MFNGHADRTQNPISPEPDLTKQKAYEKNFDPRPIRRCLSLRKHLLPIKIVRKQERLVKAADPIPGRYIVVLDDNFVGENAAEPRSSPLYSTSPLAMEVT